MDPEELRRRFLATTIDFAVMYCSLDGVIEAWLGASERVLGYSSDEAVGMSLSVFFTEDDKRRHLDINEIAVARTQGRSEDDRWHVRKDGSTFWASGVLTVVTADDGKPLGLCKILRDKTDVRTQIETLENQAVAMQIGSETERRNVSTLVHEIRNSLMPINSALTMLQRPEMANFADRARNILISQVGVLKRLLEDLSATGTKPASMLCLTLDPVNLTVVLTELIDSIQDAAQVENQTISLVVPSPDIWVSADAARLQQMLLNLLNNALKYTGRDGRINVSATVEADMAVIRIEDNGIGISADFLPRIFELFTREEQHRDVDGKGVGLAVVEQLVTAHGGFVEARSPGQGKGSTFTVRIPALPTREPSA